MSGAFLLAIGAPTILLLLLSGLWTDRRFSDFEELPSHYGLRGEPTRFAPRWVMAWVLPIGLSALLVAILFSFWATPPEWQKGEPVSGAIFACACMLGSQAFVCWLHHRWASRQN